MNDEILLFLASVRVMLLGAMSAYLLFEAAKNHYVRKRFRPLVATGGAMFALLLLQETARMVARVRLMETGQVLPLDTPFWIAVSALSAVGIGAFFVAFVAADRDAKR